MNPSVYRGAGKGCISIADLFGARAIFKRGLPETAAPISAIHAGCRRTRDQRKPPGDRKI
jgi:hypothetical protein